MNNRPSTWLEDLEHALGDQQILAEMTTVTNESSPAWSRPTFM